MIRIFLVCMCFFFLSRPALAVDRLTLKDALESVDIANLQVLMANARVEQAIARISESRAELLPHLDGLVSGSRQTTDLRSEGLEFPGLPPYVGPFNSFNARGRITIDLFDPGAFERFRAAKKGEGLSGAQLEKAREDTLALVADLFVDAQRKQQTAKLLQTILEKDRKAYELSNQDFEQGTGSEIDANKSKTNMDLTRYLYQQAQNQADDARRDLEAALQIPLNKPLELIDDRDFLKLLEERVAVEYQNVTNADMAMASAQLEADQASKNAAVADFLPTVSGEANYGRLGASPDNASNTYTVGAQVSVPIWEGGSQQADLKEAKAKVKEDKENLRDAGQQQEVDIAKARASILEATVLKESKDQALQTAQKSLLIAFHAQQIGTDTILQLMQAKSDLATAEDDYNEAQATWEMALIDLLHAEGKLRDLIKPEEGDQS